MGERMIILINSNGSIKYPDWLPLVGGHDQKGQGNFWGAGNALHLDPG